MNKKILIRFVGAFLLALLGALIVQQLISSIAPQVIDKKKFELVNILMLLIVLNLATVVIFVVIQCRLLETWLKIPVHTMIVWSTICGPVSGMAGFVLATQTGNGLLGVLPLVIGQMLFVRRLASSSSLSVKDDNSQSST